MRIRKLSLDNDPIFGTQSFDFTNNDRSVDTVIIAGENGCGKTSLLNLLYEFNNITVNMLTEPGMKRVYEIELDSQDQVLWRNHLSADVLNSILQIEINSEPKTNWQQVKIINPSTGSTTNGVIFGSQDAKKRLNGIFSQVEINFNPTDIKNVTATGIDATEKSIKSSHNLATEIAQLLIDIESADARDFMRHAKDLKDNKDLDRSKIDARMRRFTNAFNYMFPSKRYVGVEDVNSSKKVYFEEHGKKMDILQLSSGEKQIVFRGSFLLKDKESLNGATVYIDEPEISLHPTWQIKILPFLKSLFRNEKSEQTSQIFIATHSPFIIHNENRENDKVIILKNDGGKISVSGERKFHFWDREKIVQEAFNISHDLQIEPKGLTVFVEGPTDEKYLTKANELYQISKNIRFKSIGQNTKQGSQGGGDTGLNNARTFLLANPEHMRGAAVLYYDPDKKMNAQDFDSLHIRGMPVLDNKVFRKGIENLLSLPDDFDRTAFYRKKETVDDYGAKKDNEEFQKVLLCDFICSLPSERASVYLVNVADTIRSQLLGLIP